MEHVCGSVRLPASQVGGRAGHARLPAHCVKVGRDGAQAAAHLHGWRGGEGEGVGKVGRQTRAARSTCGPCCRSHALLSFVTHCTQADHSRPTMKSATAAISLTDTVLMQAKRGKRKPCNRGAIVRLLLACIGSSRVAGFMHSKAQAAGQHQWAPIRTCSISCRLLISASFSAATKNTSSLQQVVWDESDVKGSVVCGPNEQPGRRPNAARFGLQAGLVQCQQ